MKSLTHNFICAALALLLVACATPPAHMAYFDFGALPAISDSPTCTLPPIYVAEVSGTAALDSNLMLYRLQYANDMQSHAYANHRWSMTPAQLMSVRVKSQLAARHVQVVDNGMANPNGWQLRLDLTDFSQHFSDASHSNAQLSLRATLLRNNSLVSQTTLTRQVMAATADAPGGALAMRSAADALITDLDSWLCKQPHP